MAAIPSLTREKHVRYWLRCLKTYLPAAYTEYDTQRMTLVFFILSALDLLSVLDDTSVVSAAEHRDYLEWIYDCQHPDGGFRSSPAVQRDGSDVRPASLSATFFALSSLLLLGDNLAAVRKRACWARLVAYQLDDGSFCDALDTDGRQTVGNDVRYCYLAAGVRWILRQCTGQADRDGQDVNTQALVDFVHASFTYEGGIGKAPSHEAHAGWTYCGIGALSLLDRLPIQTSNPLYKSSATITAHEDETFLPPLLYWLCNRQTTYITDETINPESGPSDSGSTDTSPSACATGFNGRNNKIADTCYSFWVGGSLAMLGHLHLIDHAGSQDFLLSKTQHVIGGFGKTSGDSPDILHSYLGLAALATIKYPGLRSIEPSLCISVRAIEDFVAKTKDLT